MGEDLQRLHAACAGWPTGRNKGSVQGVLLGHPLALGASSQAGGAFALAGAFGRTSGYVFWADAVLVMEMVMMAVCVCAGVGDGDDGCLCLCSCRCTGPGQAAGGADTTDAEQLGALHRYLQRRDESAQPGLVDAGVHGEKPGAQRADQPRLGCWC